MGPLPFLLLLAAVTVRSPQTPLRGGCDADAQVLAQLDPGVSLEVRFAIAGEDCYKVRAEIDGKVTEGYLASANLEGLDQFDKLRRDAAWADASQILRSLQQTPARHALAAPQENGGLEIVSRGSPRIQEAAKLIEASQPSRALAVLEKELEGPRRDPGVLAMAGIAAWRSDDVGRALEYWRDSLEIAPNPDLERLYRRLERETKADKSADRMVGMRVLLRYEGQTVPPETARLMVSLLDEEYSRIAAKIGCATDERVVAIVQSVDAYRRSTDAAEWSGGQFDGRIRVPLHGSIPVDQLRRTFSHEIVHACLATLGNWPAWFHEGLAQRLSGERLAPLTRHQIESLARARAIPRLSAMGQDWSRMSERHASLAYALSLAAIELFEEHWGAYGIRNLLSNPGQLERITADLEKRLGFSGRP
jgi:hypothetical protein